MASICWHCHRSPGPPAASSASNPPGSAGTGTGEKSKGFVTDVLDRPGCQVLQIRHEGLELPGREGWIPIDVLPHGSEGGLADS